MDLSKTLQVLKAKDREDEILTKDLLALSAKKYNLHKELENLKAKIFVKKGELKRLKQEVATLSLEVPVLEKQEETLKKYVRDLVKQIVAKNAETETTQEIFWIKINSFVSDYNWLLTKQETSMRNGGYNWTEAAGRDDEIRQLKLEGELKAMQLYEKYQTTKMEELKLIKDLLEKDSFVI